MNIRMLPHNDFVNRIRLYKTLRDLRWKEICYATGIKRMRLLHLANNQQVATLEEATVLATFFKCEPYKFLHPFMDVDLSEVL